MSEYAHTHPLYDARCDDWRMMADVYEGERKVKSKGDDYLPITSGQRALGMATTSQPGRLLYEAYKRRAVFPEITRQTARQLAGVMMREPWAVTVPAALEPILDALTDRGEDVHTLIDRSITRVLMFGRTAYLVDVREATSLPYIADYPSLAIINWDDSPPDGELERRLRLVVIDESRPRRLPGQRQWTDSKRYRELSLTDSGVYQVLVEIDGVEGQPLVPMLQGRSIDGIPLTFVNAIDLSPTPGDVPLLDLGKQALTIYRTEADYRQTLFMQTQETLVIRGLAGQGGGVSQPDANGHVTYTGDSQSGSSEIIGAGAVIYLPDPVSDAKFVGVSGNGLGELRQAIENDYARAEQFGMSMLAASTQAEAAETVARRSEARTASLVSIAKSIGSGLEAALKNAARWYGANPDEVSVEPNLDWAQAGGGIDDVLKLINAKRAGASVTWEDVHRALDARGFVSQTFEEAMAAIADEPPMDEGDMGEEEDEGQREDG